MDPNPGGGGYGIEIETYAADNLVENNMVWSFNKVIAMRSSGGGNVIGYDYMEDAYGAGYPTIVEVGRQLRPVARHRRIGSRFQPGSDALTPQLALPHEQACLLRIESVAVGRSQRDDQDLYAARESAFRWHSPLRFGPHWTC